MGKGKGKKIAVSTIFSWAFELSRDLWVALGPVWTTINNLWDTIRPLWNQVRDIWDYLRGLAGDFYVQWLKPVWDAIDTVWSQVEESIRLLDRLYQETVGRIEQVYDILFGRFEALWRDFEDFRDKIVRLVGQVNDSLADRIVQVTEDIERNSIGRVRDLRDEILNKIDEFYTELRARINDFYWAVKDIIDPVRELVVKVEDFLNVTFEPVGRLRRSTLYESTRDLYGWVGREKIPTRDDDIQERIYTLIGIAPRDLTDPIVEDLDAGAEGPWGDVHSFVDEAVYALGVGQPPAGFYIDGSKLTPDERDDVAEVVV